MYIMNSILVAWAGFCLREVQLSGSRLQVLGVAKGGGGASTNDRQYMFFFGGGGRDPYYDFLEYYIYPKKILMIVNV